jgi:hypothetical protein
VSTPQNKPQIKISRLFSPHETKAPAKAPVNGFKMICETKTSSNRHTVISATNSSTGQWGMGNPDFVP